jgi:hypothetical protein
MGADSEDEEDYVYVGTPLDAPPPGPHRTGAATAATKNLPVWKQTPTDERGRPRFHGKAATLGFREDVRLNSARLVAHTGLRNGTTRIALNVAPAHLPRDVSDRGALL